MHGPSNAGFTLLETLLTAVVLSTGLAACAILFSYSIATNIRSQQRTTATLLLHDKLEELRNNPTWENGEFREYITMQQTGGTNYVRAWTIRDGKATVHVAERSGDLVIELANATITAGRSF